MYIHQRCWTHKRPFAFNIKRLLASPSVHPSKAAGDISSVFPSLKPGSDPVPLPPRFAELKRRLIRGHEDRVLDSWYRLLADLRKETEVVKALGSSVIPEIAFNDMHNMGKRTEFRDQLHKRGVAIVRGVVSEQEALGWKELLRRYIQTNPSTKGQDTRLYFPLLLSLLRIEPPCLREVRSRSSWRSCQSKSSFYWGVVSSFNLTTASVLERIQHHESCMSHVY